MAAVAMDVEVEEAALRPRVPWWLFLITGIGWILVSIVILGFDAGSVLTIAFMTGVVLVAAGINEIVEAAVGPGWRWAHALLGVLFLLSGLAAFARPLQTFGILAVLIGWFLVIKGTFDVTFSIAARHEMPLWGILLASGLISMAIGIWALGYPGRSAWLLILWVGLGALMRGISQIILAFSIHHDAGLGA